MIENYSCDNQMSIFDLDGWSGKTCLDASVPAPPKAKTSASSLKKQQGSSSRMPLFLDLRSGHTADASWETGGPLLGGYMMRSFGERPERLMDECLIEEPHNGVSVSRLSQILEDTAHPKYSLSARACSGILRRAEKRGKSLPPVLKEALEQQLSRLGGGCERDSGGRKAGKGALIQWEKSATLGVSQDQTLFASKETVHAPLTGETDTPQVE